MNRKLSGCYESCLADEIWRHQFIARSRFPISHWHFLLTSRKLFCWSRPEALLAARWCRRLNLMWLLQISTIVYEWALHVEAVSHTVVKLQAFIRRLLDLGFAMVCWNFSSKYYRSKIIMLFLYILLKDGISTWKYVFFTQPLLDNAPLKFLIVFCARREDAHFELLCGSINCSSAKIFEKTFQLLKCIPTTKFFNFFRG